MKKTIGILGGMGPEATAYFYELLIKKTKATKDQEHIKVIIYSNPEVPPRTDAILGKGPSPVPELAAGVKFLQEAGVDFIVMPCVTAHYYYNDILAQRRVAFVNLLDETLLYAVRKLPRLKKAGLVSSSGTLKSRLFHDVFSREGIEIIAPEDMEQELVMEAIFSARGIKAGYISGWPRKIILGASKVLIDRGAEAIIAGCTEVPLVLKEEDIPVPLLEPLKILAEVSIAKAGYELRSD